jgi:hypothetical protein
MILSARDLEIIETLNTRVRILSLADIAAVVEHQLHRPGNAAKRLAALVGQGFVPLDALAQPMLRLESPEYAWFPVSSRHVFSTLLAAASAWSAIRGGRPFIREPGPWHLRRYDARSS